MPVEASYVKFAKGTPSARFLKFCNLAQICCKLKVPVEASYGQTPAKRRPEKTPWRECHDVLSKIFLKCQPTTTFCCKPRLPKCPWRRAMSNLPRGPPARVFRNSAKLGPGQTPAKRRPEKTPWRECHHVLSKISLKCKPSTTFCCKPRLPKCPWSRAMSNLPRGRPAGVF